MITAEQFIRYMRRISEANVAPAAPYNRNVSKEVTDIFNELGIDTGLIHKESWVFDGLVENDMIKYYINESVRKAC
jgi:hypothetical protein